MFIARRTPELLKPAKSKYILISRAIHFQIPIL